jgi:translocation and assembly module TamB
MSLPTGTFILTMARASSIIKRVLKIVAWLSFSIVLLLITIALLVQVPFIQRKLTLAATSYISDKTHTKVEIKQINFRFPKSINLEGVYLDDLQKDTLLYAGNIYVNISLTGLFQHQIQLNNIELQNTTIYLNRKEADSLFNYNFLLTAFSDSTRQEKDTSAKNKWDLQLKDISLHNIILHYHDEYGGSSADIVLGGLKLKIDKIKAESQLFDISELFIENLSAKVLISKVSQEKQTTGNSLPVLKVKKVDINNSSISFIDSVNEQSVIAGIHLFELQKLALDLNAHTCKLDKILLSENSMAYSRKERSKTAATEQNASEKSNWTVSVNDAELKNNKAMYDVYNIAQLEKVFDANHMSYSDISLKADDILYSATNTKVNLKKFHATDKNGFVVQELSASFSMTPHSIETKKINLKTSSSAATGSVSLYFSSLEKLKDSIPFMKVMADLTRVQVKNSDITYFSPALRKQSFFKNPDISTSVSGQLKGTINNLAGNNVLITTGNGTSIKTNFIIGGLPDVKTLYLYFPDLKVNTGRADIELIAGKTVIPEGISLPGQISLLVNFKGRLKNFISTVGLSSDYGSAHMYAVIDEKENFSASAEVNQFDLGLLLKNKKMYGPVSIILETKGHGLDKNTVTATIKAKSSEFYLNNYTYRDLRIDGKVAGAKFDGSILLNDVNAALEFKGMVNLNKDHEEYKFNLDLQGADLQKLNFTTEDMRIGFRAVSDLKGNSAATINGKAGITEIIIVHDEKKYILDSLLFASINEKGRSELSISSAVIGVEYSGTFSPSDLVKEVKKFIANYFPLDDLPKDTAVSSPQNFNFKIELHDHPVLSEVFFPELKEFDPGAIEGSFDSKKRELIFTAGMRKLTYGSLELSDVTIDLNSDAQAINYQLKASGISNSQLNLDNLMINGKLGDSVLTALVLSTDENKIKKFQAGASLTKENDVLSFKIDPDLFIMNNKWNVAPDNVVEINNNGFRIHNLLAEKTESSIKVASVHDHFNDDLNIAIRNLHLEELSGIIEKDTIIASGNVNGNILLIKVNQAYGIVADATIDNLSVKEIPIGNLVFRADNQNAEKYVMDVALKGPGNDVYISGYLKLNDPGDELEMEANIKSISLKTAEAFSFGKITNTSGTANGEFSIRGKMKEPEITGFITLNNAILRPSVLNTNLKFTHETITLKKDGIYIDHFTVLDSNDHAAIINGVVRMNRFKDLQFDLTASTSDFTLFNTTEKQNEVYYGRMIVDSKIDVKGTANLPLINARVKLKKGSTFTFAVPEKKLTTDKGEGVVSFIDSTELHTILRREENKRTDKSEFKGIDISSIIEVDREATLRLIIDPYSGDSLVVKGDAALSFALDPSGKMSLTGAYDLNEGSYLVSFESVLKRKFSIEPGGTIIWNGDPLDATVSINAIYSVRASPVDLVADQLAGLSENELAGYKQRYPFLVFLKLRGDLLHPEISFEIQLPPEEKGIMSGAVNAKLNMLNEDPSALNKQVFALLVIGRFVQENPLQTETNAASAAARTTVSKFLSAQLNQLGAQLVPGVELNFDVNSYDDYSSGQSEGRTEVEVGVKKQLFDERLTVQVGGSVDVEGEKAKQNSTSDITSDVSLEYKMSKDGRYRLKGFRHNQYEGALEGQLVETGAGLLYVKDFDKWREFLRPNRKKKTGSDTK